MNRLPNYLFIFISLVAFDAAKAQTTQPQATSKPSEVIRATSQPTGSGPIKYGGTMRPKVWFDEQYRKFADKISLVNGKYLDIGPQVLQKPIVSNILPEIGEYRIIPQGQLIFQPITKDKALIQTWFLDNQVNPLGGQSKPMLFYLSGLAPERNIKDAAFQIDTPIIYTGPYSYETVQRAPQVIQGYILYQKLTPEQFRQAIDSGLKLATYKQITVKEMLDKPQGGGLVNGPPLSREVFKVKIIPTPVP